MLTPYPYTTEPDLTVFSFTSHGRQGAVAKQITFIDCGPNLYNLRLHDIDADETTGLNRTGNGDAQRVIDTVIAAIAQFLRAYPTRWVMFYSGEPHQFDPVRMRLYRRGMVARLPYIEARVVAYGMLPDNRHEPFDSTHVYNALLFQALPTAA